MTARLSIRTFFLLGVVIVCEAPASACAPPGALCEAKEPLVDAEEWTFVEESASESLWAASPSDQRCGPADIQVANFGDEAAVEIDTRSGCGFATVTQPLSSSLSPGDRVQVRIFYFSQTTFPRATALVEVALDDLIVVTERVPIPSESGLIAPIVVVPQEIPAGSLAHFHVGNHGDNSWNLIELSRIFERPCDEALPGS